MNRINIKINKLYYNFKYIYYDNHYSYMDVDVDKNFIKYI